MGTFLVCWQKGTGLGMRVSRRPPHGYAVSSLFAGPFDGWSRQSMAAARCYMIRSQVDWSLALAMALAGAGFVPDEVT